MHSILKPAVLTSYSSLPKNNELVVSVSTRADSAQDKARVVVCTQLHGSIQAVRSHAIAEAAIELLKVPVKYCLLLTDKTRIANTCCI